MTRYGSDKGDHRWHNYTTIYSVLFKELQDRPLRIFELGLGTNNPDLVSNMGVDGCPGASLRGWRHLFPNASVFGADIDRRILFQERRIRTFYCDQCDPTAIREMWSNPVLKGGMDIIIDDGLHTFEGNISFLNESLGQLRPGGFYIVEDITREAINRWPSVLESVYTKNLPDHQFFLIEMPNTANTYDNNLLVIRRSVGPPRRQP